MKSTHILRIIFLLAFSCGARALVAQELSVQFLAPDGSTSTQCDCNLPQKAGDSLIMEIILPDTLAQAELFYLYMRNTKNNARLHRLVLRKRDVLNREGRHSLQIPVAIKRKRGKAVAVLGKLCRKKKSHDMWLEIKTAKYLVKQAPHELNLKPLTGLNLRSASIPVRIEKALPPDNYKFTRSLMVSGCVSLVGLAGATIWGLMNWW